MEIYVLANKKWNILEGCFSSIDTLFSYLDAEVKKGNIQPYDRDKLKKLISVNGFYFTSEFEPFMLYKNKII